ncbi:MAG TPA: urease accessory protein UreD [Candidatus Synoicihabitans sp.]|nr:urease accessory protein UreD [Candidatus Synoicihabitans sp.]
MNAPPTSADDAPRPTTEFAGNLLLRAAPNDTGRTVLAAQSFRAPFHLSKPYWDDVERVLIAQVVNPTAGILAGDRLKSTITVDPGAALLVTTPSASRVFRMQTGDASSHQRYQVAAGGWLEVWPEPLVLHRGARYRQQTELTVETGGAAFVLDQFMPGRLGHGEAWMWDSLALALEVRWAGQLVLRERIASSAAALRALAEFTGSGATACFANAVLLGEPARPAAEWLPAVAALHGEDVWLGISALRHGGWSVRCVARGPIQLRDVVRELRRRLVPAFPYLHADPRKL